VRRGETVGIIGRNGSGKSTLLQLICGTLRPSAGEIEVRGRVAALLELGAGFNPDFTGRENVYLSASILGLSEGEITARFAAIEAFAGIGEFIDRPVRQYSSGMYARLAFAVCAHVDADILVIDEILAVGDAAFQQKCMRYLHAFRAQGTLLFVSHDEAAVLGLCERALWLDRGVMRACGPSKEVCRRYLAAQAEEADESGGFRIGGSRTAAAASGLTPPRDMRWSGANPIEIFDFDPDAPWHGHGGAVIEHAGFFTPDGRALAWAAGGEEVELQIACRAERALARPVVGFILRNRLGQHLFGDNTHLTYRDDPRPVAPGQRFTAAFRFQLPYLPTGDYMLAPSIIEGTQADHIHLHWMEEALLLSVSASPIRRGAVGLTMREIRIDRHDPARSA
jgi:lipopolysaccharide transport system ATP-binding protein